MKKICISISVGLNWNFECQNIGAVGLPNILTYCDNFQFITNNLKNNDK